MSGRVVVWAPLGVLAAALAYLTLWPVPIDAVAWDAPAPPPLTGAFAPNDLLRGAQRVGEGVTPGAEAVAVDAQGRPHTGTRDGRILRFEPSGGAPRTLASTGGRPLGLAFGKGGVLYVCDAVKGLLALDPSGSLRTLATAHGGVRFGFTDDVDVAPDGTVYFSDASSKFGPTQYREDILEHGGRGRLLAWDPATGATRLLLSGLQFANGVAVAGDGSYVLVNETGAYRVTRYWLAGPRRGTSEPFIENLPGIPDNITWSAERRAFWIALFTPRVKALDLLAPHPFLREVVFRLPMAVQPKPARHAWALAVDEQGRVVESLQDRSPEAYAPVTSVREAGGVLWLGSLERDGLARVAAPPLPPAASAARAP
ncbi:MAG TPA: SMP-30/gluconolactonase/LRE family protein [Anaeromyxobacteraceae bacterium]|nr:SMP-30/gluconolactonase/LRE family protein [Anaeromyxobacteraceae bacterium]